ncbi:hypothetical protein ACLI2H_16055, partial [Enterococcus faecalis]|uniref:hypothetical protein n=1 Tax=Enterococcus faecalis TaxID=1351 RepID=UPI0039846CCB
PEDLYDRMTMPVPYGPVQRGHIYGIASSFGLVPEAVTQIHIEPDCVTVTTQHANGGSFKHKSRIEDAQG